ncbi:MAG: B12-binding domain-containing radical SAM protein [Candidatus Omnitrophica bacterium]|nr:B12-binding domain-containing radical SAM protein [Candidatus Omnitrophota bacterium]
MYSKKTKALLVNPPRGQIKPTTISDYFYPFSLIYLMNYSLKAGYHVDLYDLYMDPYEGLIEVIRNDKPHVIGVTSQALNRFEAMEVLKKIKTDFPEVLTVLGGKFFVDGEGFGEEILKSESYIDMVVVGEGEETFKEILDAIENKTTFKKIKGLVYRDKFGKIIENEKRRFTANLDEFAIDFNVLPEKISNRYSAMVTLRNFEVDDLRGYAMLIGRGCVGKCIFCERSTNPLYSVRSVESCLEEIETVIKKNNTRYFSFNDPCLTNRHSFVKNLCNAIIERKLNIKWCCEARVDTPIEVLELMRKAGCVSVDFGVESGSPRILKIIKKAINIDMVVKFADACNNLGIRSGAFFMISHPDEREEDVGLTLKLIRRLCKKHIPCRLGFTMILPNTELERIARERNILPKDFSWLDKGYSHDNKFVQEKTIPPYVEHLSLHYVGWVIAEADKIFLLSMSLMEYIKWRKDNFGTRSLLINLLDLSLGLSRPLRHRLGLRGTQLSRVLRKGQ